MSDGIVPSDRSVEQLAAEITAAAVRMAAATAAWLRLIAEFDEREGWAGAGLRSCAHWLAWQCGLSPGAAREHVRVARALRSLPRISAAFDEGRLSFSKVRAVTRVADAGTEADLLEFALEATASQTERTVRQWRRADRVDAGTIETRRQFEFWWDDDGMLVLRARLDPEEGAAVLAAVDSLAERAARRERAAAKRAARTDSAAAEAAPAGTASGGDVSAGGSPGGADDEGRDFPAGAGWCPDETGELLDGADPRVSCPIDDEVELARERTTARRCRALAELAGAAAVLDRRPGDPPRREVVVHVDAALIADDAAAGRAYLEGGPALHPADVRRMLCEATVITMLESGREVLAVGRKRRLATRAQRRALLRRDGGCARPGCPETRIERLHAHHLRPWLLGGRTDLANMVLLCDVDHGLAHDLDLRMVRRDGRLIVTAPDGRTLWGPADTAFTGVSPLDAARARRPGGATRDAGPVAASGSIGALLFPDGEPDLPGAMRVNGERISIAYVVGVLLGNRDVARRLAAETGATAA